MIPETEHSKKQKTLRKVLIIEDSQTARTYLKLVLSNQYKGIEIKEAKDGTEGRSVLKSTSVDLIITDLEMEGMNGVSFVEMMQGNRVLAKKPIIIYSSSITPELMTQIGPYQNVRALKKSTDSNLLYKTIEELLK